MSAHKNAALLKRLAEFFQPHAALAQNTTERSRTTHRAPVPLREGSLGDKVEANALRGRVALEVAPHRILDLFL
jgi:hypothetical protein